MPIPSPAKKILNQSKEAWNEADPGTAFKLLKKIEQNPEVLQEFDSQWQQELRVRLQWCALPLLPEDEKLDLITHHLLVPLRDKDFPLDKPFYFWELMTPTAAWLDLVPKILETFMNNQERFNIVSPAGPDQPQSLGEFAKDYFKTYGMDKQNEMAVLNYLSRSPYPRTLSPADQAVLKRLLTLFESLKIFTISQVVTELKKFIESDQFASEVNASQKSPFPGFFYKNYHNNSASVPSESSPNSLSSSRPSPSASPFPSVSSASTSAAPPPTSAPPTTPSGSPAPNPSLTAPKTLKTALQENPKIANQKITSQPLSVLGRGGNLAPTVENWLLDYRSRYGNTENTDQERQEFLYKSPNGQKLDASQRKNLQLLLEAHDKNTALNISESDNTIVFPN